MDSGPSPQSQGVIFTIFGQFLDMSPVQKYEIILSEFDKKYYYELIYIPIFFIGFFYLQFGTNSILSDQFRNLIIFSSFGFLHIFSSRALSFLYNLTWVIFPIAIKPNHRLLQFLGLLILAACVFSYLKNMLFA